MTENGKVLAKTEKDPVCGMSVQPESAASRPAENSSVAVAIATCSGDGARGASRSALGAVAQPVRERKSAKNRQSLPAPRGGRWIIGKRLTPTFRGMQRLFGRDVSLDEDSPRKALLREDVELEGKQELLEIRPSVQLDGEDSLLADRVAIPVFDPQAHGELVTSRELGLWNLKLEDAVDFLSVIEA